MKDNIKYTKFEKIDEQLVSEIMYINKLGLSGYELKSISYNNEATCKNKFCTIIEYVGLKRFYEQQSITGVKC